MDIGRFTKTDQLKTKVGRRRPSVVPHFSRLGFVTGVESTREEVLELAYAHYLTFPPLNHLTTLDDRVSGVATYAGCQKFDEMFPDIDLGDGVGYPSSSTFVASFRMSQAAPTPPDLIDDFKRYILDRV